jgi:hypothetical protein
MHVEFVPVCLGVGKLLFFDVFGALGSPASSLLLHLLGAGICELFF